MKHIELLNNEERRLDTFTMLPCCNTCDGYTCGCDTYVCGAGNVCGCDVYTCGCNVACNGFDPCGFINY